MRTLLLLSQVALAAALPAAPTHADDATDGWLTDHAEAVETARRTSRPILADFTGSDWCGWCIKLHKEVFDTDEFRTWAADNVVLLELDFPRAKPQSDAVKTQNAALRKRYGIQGYPTILFLDHEGEVVGRSGYMRGGPDAWIADAEKKLAAFQPAPVPDAWITSYRDALVRASDEDKLILADFTGSDWCGWCIRLDDEVFDTDAFRAWAADNVVLLKLDFPRAKPQSDAVKAQNVALRTKHGVQGYPTILFLDADGEKVGELGYEPGGPEVWLPAAKKIVEASRAAEGATGDPAPTKKKIF